MLFGIIIIIILFGSLVLMIWYSIKKEEKESREPLGNDIKNHYFIKAILDITNEIKNLKQERVRSFLSEEAKGKQSICEVTPYLDYTTESILGVSFGAIGALLTTSSAQKSHKIETIELIRNNWVYYLSCKVIKDNMPKKEKRKIEDDIRNKIDYLLNLKVLSITNQSSIKEAWMIILKDKALTRKALNQLWGKVKLVLGLKD